jgi:hypothetical protein
VEGYHVFSGFLSLVERVTGCNSSGSGSSNSSYQLVSDSGLVDRRGWGSGWGIPALSATERDAMTALMGMRVVRIN